MLGRRLVRAGGTTSPDWRTRSGSSSLMTTRSKRGRSSWRTADTIGRRAVSFVRSGLHGAPERAQEHGQEASPEDVPPRRARRPATGSPVSTTTWRNPSRRAIRMRAASSAPCPPRPRYAGSVAAIVAHAPGPRRRERRRWRRAAAVVGPEAVPAAAAGERREPAAEVLREAERRGEQLAHPVRVAPFDRPDGESRRLRRRHRRARIADELHPGVVALVAARRDRPLAGAALRDGDEGGEPRRTKNRSTPAGSAISPSAWLRRRIPGSPAAATQSAPPARPCREAVARGQWRGAADHMSCCPAISRGLQQAVQGEVASANTDVRLRAAIPDRRAAWSRRRRGPSRRPRALPATLRA